MTTAEKSGAAALILPTKQDVLDATNAAVEKLTAELAALPADAWKRPACGEWNVDQTVAHIGLGPIAYGNMIDQMTEGGQDELFDVTDPDFAEMQNDLIGEAEPQERIDSVIGAITQFTEGAATVPDDRMAELTWTPEGIMPVAAALGIALNELTVHSFEVRTATGLDPLPAEGNPAALTAFTVYAFSGLIRNGGWPAVELTVSGNQPVVLAWDGERAVVGADAEPQVRVSCGAGVLALLLWGRLSVEQAKEHGLVVDGPADGIESLFAAAKPF